MSAAQAIAADPGDAVWADAVWAAALLAVDPQGLGGIVVRASAGPVRDRLIATLRQLLPAAEPLRRMPAHIADERLLGGLDLAATLASGRPVAQRGLLAEADGGIVLLPMAERLPSSTVARLCGVLDRAEVGFERDGIGARWPARIGIVACDEGTADDPPLAAALRDRLAFEVDLRDLSVRAGGDAAAALPQARDVIAARAALASVTVPETLLPALCATALQLGVPSLRACLHALHAARAAAALGACGTVDEAAAKLAARLVLAPRATRLPPPAADDEAAEAAADGPAEAEAPAAPPPPSPQLSPSPSPPPPNDAAGDRSEAPATPPFDAAPAQQADAQALEDRLVDAAVAALPADLLAALLQGAGSSQAGRVGALVASARGGRPLGTRRGSPRSGARLALVETLRAAAPWQALRRRAALPGSAGRIHVTVDDLRVARLQQRSATATLFVIDASGSSALHRLAEAKGAINLLLADCYVRRDQVAVIGFRGAGAELLLPPTRSLVRAKRCLAALPGGGGTPLAAGIEAALRLAEQVRRGGITPLLVLLTDGRANIARDGKPGRARAEEDALAMARQVRAARLTSLLIDTSQQPAAAAQRLAAAMSAQYRALPHAGAAAVKAAVTAAFSVATRLAASPAASPAARTPPREAP